MYVETESSFIYSNAPLTAQDGHLGSITMPAVSQPLLGPSTKRHTSILSHILHNAETLARDATNKGEASKGLLDLTPVAANLFGPHMDEIEHARLRKGRIYDAGRSQDVFLLWIISWSSIRDSSPLDLAYWRNHMRI